MTPSAHRRRRLHRAAELGVLLVLIVANPSKVLDGLAIVVGGAYLVHRLERTHDADRRIARAERDTAVARDGYARLNRYVGALERRLDTYLRGEQ